jgi:transposase-like protein
VQYTQKFKNEMVRKMTGPTAMSANRLSQECGIGQPTLSKWLRQAKLGAMAPKKTPDKVQRKLWTPEEKMRVVWAAAGAADATERGTLLRREGLHEADLERFQKELSELLKDAKPARQKRDPADKKRIKELERDLRRKERALAEATALVVLSKKVQAYFEEDEVGGTDEESEK